MEKGQLQLNKWHFKFGIIPNYWRMRGYMFNFGIFKIINLPKEGWIGKDNYKGFWIRKEFDWKGFEIHN